MNQKFLKIIYLLVCFYLFSGCTVKNKITTLPEIPEETTQILSDRKLEITFIPQEKQTPDYLFFSQQDTYSFNNNQISSGFKKELFLDPLMRRVVFRAEVRKGNKIVSSFEGQKRATSVTSQNKTTWAPTLQKQVIIIPHIKPTEHVIVYIKYEWMDSRWFPPLMLEGAEPTIKSQLLLHTPFGVTTRYQVTQNKQKIQISPANQAVEKKVWQRDDNSRGQGNTLVFSHQSQNIDNSKKTADRTQIFVRFETPRLEENLLPLDSWEAISRYLYQKFERYDIPNNIIREFSVKKTSTCTNNQEKVKRVIDFVSTIERRFYNLGFREQIAQPAGITLGRRIGSPFDIAILLKAMLKSLNIESDIVAVGHRDINPMLPNFYSPTLFNSFLVMIELENNFIYFDPNAQKLTLGAIPDNLQGQLALKIGERDGKLMRIPYDPGENNQTSYTFDLKITSEGILLGDYSIQYTGKSAPETTLKPTNDHNLLSAQEFQNTLIKPEAQILPWKTAMLEASSLNNLKISGQILNRLLSQTENQKYDLEINNLINPIKFLFNLSTSKYYSSRTNIKISITLPKNTKLNIIPENFNINTANISARLSYNLTDDLLLISGDLIFDQPVLQQNKTMFLDNLNTYVISDPILLEENLDIQAQQNHEAEKEI